MIREDHGDTFSRKSEMFPYMPLQSDVSSQDKTNMTTYKGFCVSQSEKNNNETNAPHHQHRPLPLPVDKLSLPRLECNVNKLRRRYAGGYMIRQMDGLTLRPQETIEINPVPAPYKSQDFLSSTVMKNMPISKRHQDTFNTLDNLYSGKRGVALHTQRYNWDSSRSLDSMSQRDRLIAEIESLERLRDIRRKTEILPHRLPLDMCMGGKRLDIEERFDINREIRRLKTMVLPEYAKDLYHGRGINLPSNHASKKPRKNPIPDDDSDDGVTSSAPASLRQVPPKYPFGSETSRLNQSTRSSIDSFNRKEKLPQIHKHGQLGFDLDSSLSRYNTEALPSVNRNPASWVEEQNQHIEKRSKSIERENVDVRIPDAEFSNTKSVTPGSPSPTAGGTSMSPSSTKPITPHPLKGTELVSHLPEGHKEVLTETFKKLDTDSDGHLKFNQLKTELPSDVSPQQEQFLRQVYEITSSSTFFGVDEFMTMSQLGKTINELGEEAKEAYKVLDDVEIKQFIIHYIDLFQSVDRNQSGKISLNSLRGTLSTALDVDLEEDMPIWVKIITTLNLVKPNQITKIEYLAHLPFFHQLGIKS